MKAVNVKDDVKDDWMRPAAASVQVSADVESAVALMKKLEVHHLIVMEGKNYRGLLDARDCAGVFDPKTSVIEIMRIDAPVVDESEPIKQVVQMMIDRRLTAVALRRDRQVTGIITITDLLKLLENELSSGIGGAIQKGKEFLMKPITAYLSQLIAGTGI